MANLRIFFFNSETTFSKSFFLNFVLCFCAKLKDRTLKKNYWKPKTSVLLSTSQSLQIRIHFGAFLQLCGLFYINKKKIGSEVCLERFHSYGDFGSFFKSNIFILREFCKRILCLPIVKLALLLFLYTVLTVSYFTAHSTSHYSDHLSCTVFTLLLLFP